MFVWFWDFFAASNCWVRPSLLQASMVEKRVGGIEH